MEAYCDVELTAALVQQAAQRIAEGDKTFMLRGIHVAVELQLGVGLRLGSHDGVDTLQQLVGIVGHLPVHGSKAFVGDEDHRHHLHLVGQRLREGHRGFGHGTAFIVIITVIGNHIEETQVKPLDVMVVQKLLLPRGGVVIGAPIIDGALLVSVVRGAFAAAHSQA